MRFLWDPFKAKSNLIKHGISFEEAISIFLDSEAIRIFDNDHSIDEHRSILIGLSSVLRILVVVHVESENDIIRIISARRANKKETQTYIKRRS